MRLVSFERGEGPEPGVLIGEQVVPIRSLEPSVRGLRELLTELGDADLRVLAGRADASLERLGLDSVALLAPVLDPQKIICLGLNYRDHAAETGQDVPSAPLWFAKFANSLSGSGQPITLPCAHPGYVDYEAELAVVIGRPTHCVSVELALSHLAGAMCFNDVSARDLQMQNPLWTSGKAIDGFAPCGPALVTLDEIGELSGLGVRTWVNGELVQNGNTRELIFGVAEAVAWLSRTMTLLPGDIIATGTPAGVGLASGRFLRDGDVVEVAIDGLGVLRNPVRGPREVH